MEILTIYKPRYKHNPIGSLPALAKTLSLSVEELKRYAENAANYYSPNTPIIKPNGDERTTYTIMKPLKEIQRRILTKIFHSVEYPRYLQGSIKDKEHPRDYISDCLKHSGKSLIITIDISKFFDSITASHVYKMWKYFFHFPNDVAETLTSLTTHKSFLPQGSSTSPSIANLIFFDLEPQLVKKLADMGIKYSRYLDDITLSTNQFISQNDKKIITEKIYKMFFRKGVKPNRDKHKVSSRSNRMSVHNLNANKKRPTLPKEYRRNTRAMVHKLEIMSKTSDFNSEEFDKLYSSTIGKIAHMARLHKTEATKLSKKIIKIKQSI